MNAIQYFQQLDGLVISLDAKDVFDCVKWPYLFHTLYDFG